MSDLTAMAKEMEAVLKKHLDIPEGERPSMAICFTLPPGYKQAHWVTNVRREDGIALFQKTAVKMMTQAQPGTN